MQALFLPLCERRCGARLPGPEPPPHRRSVVSIVATVHPTAKIGIGA
jgi:hypothetical protein